MRKGGIFFLKQAMKKVALILTLSSLLSSSITGSPEGLINSHCLWLLFNGCVCVGGKSV